MVRFAARQLGSHDLRNKLRHVDLRSGDERELTRQLLAYSGKDRFGVEAVDLSALIVEISELLSVTIGKDKKLKLSLPKDLPSVQADATQIRQILMNLIINASEAIDHDFARNSREAAEQLVTAIHIQDVI